MSFSSNVKNELSKLNNLKNKDEVNAELLGYLSTIKISNNYKNIKFATENEYNINRYAKLLNNVNIDNYTIEMQGNTYVVTLKYTDDIKAFIKNSFENFKLKKEKVNSDSLKKAYIRGTFLGGGSVNNPENKYHLEVLFNKEEYAIFAKQIINEYGIEIKYLKTNKSLYIKDSESISELLALIGASAVLKFEEIRVLRDMKNNINRKVNCETANLNKTINAAVSQIDDIKTLRKKGLFNKLPKKLKEIAILREKNPDATLEELGNMLDTPIGKSSVSSRFKQIKEYLK